MKGRLKEGWIFKRSSTTISCHAACKGKSVERSVFALHYLRSRVSAARPRRPLPQERKAQSYLSDVIFETLCYYWRHSCGMVSGQDSQAVYDGFRVESQ
jgi:hypothetical protein